MMPYHIKDPEVDRLIRDLARRRKKPIIDAIRDACQEVLDREKSKEPFLKRVEPVRLKVQALLNHASKSSGEAS
jgi:antitoxin VapB